MPCSLLVDVLICFEVENDDSKKFWTTEHLLFLNWTNEMVVNLNWDYMVVMIFENFAYILLLSIRMSRFKKKKKKQTNKQQSWQYFFVQVSDIWFGWISNWGWWKLPGLVSKRTWSDLFYVMHVIQISLSLQSFL